MNRYFVIHSLDDLDAVAGEFLEQFHDHRVFAFYGEIGAGKTTFIKSLCNKLGVDDIAKSPTFSIINSYPILDGEVYHFDCFRIEHIRDFIAIGYEEYFNSGNYCFIEWAEKVEELLTGDVVRLAITVNEFNQSRIIQVM